MLSREAQTPEPQTPGPQPPDEHQTGQPTDPRVADLGFARLDLEREARTGHPEVVYAAGKTPAQTVASLARLADAHPGRAVLATRCDDATLALARDQLGARGHLDVDDTSRTVLLGPLPEPAGLVVVVAAGTSDLPVATEAQRTARAHGVSVELVTDVGVAGLHRLLAEVPRIARADAVVAVAGMEGALPSVLGGLIAAPLVAVPTSVGYGWSMGGLTAFTAMLVSCAPGVSVVNVDNGYGAGVAAARIARPVGLLRTAQQAAGDVPR